MKIQIGPHTFTVEYRKTDNAGETHCDEGIIRIKDGLEESRQKVVLWHEVIHALFWDRLGWYVDTIDEIRSRERREEILVDQIANATFDVLTRNEDLLDLFKTEEPIEQGKSSFGRKCQCDNQGNEVVK